MKDDDPFLRTPNGASDLLDDHRGGGDPAGERIYATLNSFGARLDDELRDLERYGVGGGGPPPPSPVPSPPRSSRSSFRPAPRRTKSSQREGEGGKKASVRRVPPPAQVTAKTASIMSDYRAFLSELHAEDAVADTELASSEVSSSSSSSSSSSPGSSTSSDDGTRATGPMATEALLASVELARGDVREKYDDHRSLAEAEEGVPRDCDDPPYASPDPPSPPADPEELLWHDRDDFFGPSSSPSSSPSCSESGALLDGPSRRPRRRYRWISPKAKRGVALFAAAAALVALSIGAAAFRRTRVEEAEVAHLEAEIEEEQAAMKQGAKSHGEGFGGLPGLSSSIVPVQTEQASKDERGEASEEGAEREAHGKYVGGAYVSVGKASEVTPYDAAPSEGEADRRTPAAALVADALAATAPAVESDVLAEGLGLDAEEDRGDEGQGDEEEGASDGEAYEARVEDAGGQAYEPKEGPAESNGEAYEAYLESHGDEWDEREEGGEWALKQDLQQLWTSEPTVEEEPEWEKKWEEAFAKFLDDDDDDDDDGGDDGDDERDGFATDSFQVATTNVDARGSKSAKEEEEDELRGDAFPAAAASTAVADAADRDPVPDPYSAAVARYRPVPYDRTTGWRGTSYRDALAFCRSTPHPDGMTRDVCPYAAVCPLGADGEPLGGYHDVDFEGSAAWIAVIDGYNEWIQGGSREGCKRWSQVRHVGEGEGKEGGEEGPEWGITGKGEGVERMTRDLLCCINVMM